jgi:hypothetical protein
VTTVQPSWAKSGYTLELSDDFTGTALNPKVWTDSWWGGGSMNNVTTSPVNVSVADSLLTLTLSSSSKGALVNSDPEQVKGGGFTYSAGMSVEARIWFPGSGTKLYNWNAFWGDNDTWPQNGEDDIAEVLSGALTTNYHSSKGALNSGAIEGSWAASWHTYGIQRNSGTNVIYWDGKEVHSYATDDKGAPHFLIFNTGYSGSNGVYGAGSEMKIDWVRAWKNP